MNYLVIYSDKVLNIVVLILKIFQTDIKKQNMKGKGRVSDILMKKERS